MPILNYTTSIDAYKTISEIQQTLARHGCRKIVIDNDEQGNPSGLTFSKEWNGKTILFALPCNFSGVLKAMEKSKSVPRSKCTKDQALRTGWRILKVWVDAQLAIVEAEVATIPEVFLSYSVVKNGKTLYDHIQCGTDLLLTQYFFYG